MAGFSRPDRAEGMFNYPRVGRSEMPPISNINFNRYLDMEPEADVQFYNQRDTDTSPAVDQDYEGYVGRSMNFKTKNLKDTAWLIPDRQYMREYRPVQKIDENRSLYSNIQGPRNGQPSFNDYTPRLGREGNIERAI